MIHDWRAHGRPHPAWLVGIVVLVGITFGSRLLAFSPVGEGVYEAIVAGTALEGVSGLAYPPPPGPPPAAL